MSASFAPTPEQVYAREQFEAGGDLAVNAYAGTGKTSTLLLLADAAPDRRVQYVAFNKAIVVEASKKFPKNAAANTAHSLAMRGYGRRVAHRLGGRRQKGYEIARILGVPSLTFETPFGRKELTKSYLAGRVMAAVSQFCQTADRAPSPRHVPYQEGLDPLGDDGRPSSWANNDALAEALLPYVRKAWADLSAPDGRLRLGHDHYLKAWQLDDPFIPADVLMFDEAQDANPVMLAIVQAQDHAQRIYVGDQFQQIYSFTGARNALGSLGDDVRLASLTQSFRFGPAIAGYANVALDDLGATRPLLGYDRIDSVVGPCAQPNAILTRTNAQAMTEVFSAIREGRRPFLVGGGKEVASFARAVEDLRNEGRTSHPELACFTSWGEVLDYVDQDPQGGELRLLVKLIEDFGTSSILEALDRMPSEKNAGVVISTAHKAKGREWHHVVLANDFPAPGSNPDAGPVGISDEELRLLYVAVTRGQLGMDVSRVPYFADAVPPALLGGAR